MGWLNWTVFAAVTLVCEMFFLFSISLVRSASLTLLHFTSVSFLPHWGRVKHIWPAPSHYLNQCWNVVNWTLRNKLQWNLNRNSNIFIQENAFESVVGETVAILSRPRCIKYVLLYYICYSWQQMWVVELPWCCMRYCIAKTHIKRISCVTTLRQTQNGLHVPDDIFKCIFFNWNV